MSRFCSLRRQGPFIGFWKSASPAANSKSVPVLPFENFSDSKENSYFSVAEQIAAALQAGLSADQRADINKKPTENVAAYDFYLRGWRLYQLYQKDEKEKAVDLFKQAIEQGRSSICRFPLAYVGSS